MALIIHRRSVSKARRLVLVGGDGRWVRPLRRLLETFGFSTMWLEQTEQLDQARLSASDVLVVADSRDAAAIVAGRGSVTPHPPLVVLTGSLHALSTPIAAEAVSLSLPLTVESLAQVLALDEDAEASVAEKRAAG